MRKSVQPHTVWASVCHCMQQYMPLHTKCIHRCNTTFLTICNKTYITADTTTYTSLLGCNFTSSTYFLCFRRGMGEQITKSKTNKKTVTRVYIYTCEARVNVYNVMCTCKRTQSDMHVQMYIKWRVCAKWYKTYTWQQTQKWYNTCCKIYL